MLFAPFSDRLVCIPTPIGHRADVLNSKTLDPKKIVDLAQLSPDRSPFLASRTQRFQSLEDILNGIDDSSPLQSLRVSVGVYCVSEFDLDHCCLLWLPLVSLTDRL